MFAATPTVGTIEPQVLEELSLEQTFLSLQQSLDDAIANQEYQTIYGDYTPQSLVQKGKELAKKFWDWLCAIFQKFWNFITGKSKKVEKAREKLKKTIDEAKKQQQDSGHTPRGSGPSTTKPPSENEKPKDVKDVGVTPTEKTSTVYEGVVAQYRADPLKPYREILLSKGYLEDGKINWEKDIETAFNVLKIMHDSANEVVEAITSIDFTKTSSNDEILGSAGVDASFVEKQYARWPKKITDFYEASDQSHQYNENTNSVGGSINKRYEYLFSGGYALASVRKKAFSGDTHAQDLADKPLQYVVTQGDEIWAKSQRIYFLLRELDNRLSKTLKTLIGTSKRMKDAGRLDKETSKNIIHLTNYVKHLASTPIDIATQLCVDTMETLVRVVAVKAVGIPSVDNQSFPRSSTMYSLANAIQAQVTQLAFEEAGIDPTAYVDDETPDPIEDPELLEKSQEALSRLTTTRQAFCDHLQSVGRTIETQDTMLSLIATLSDPQVTQLSAVGLDFVRHTLASKMKRCGISPQVGYQMIDQQSQGQGSLGHKIFDVAVGAANTLIDQSRILDEHLSQQIDHTMKIWSSTLDDVEATNELLIKRMRELQSKVQQLTETPHAGQPMTATKENVKIAQYLFLERNDGKPSTPAGRTEQIMGRLKNMEKTLSGYLENGLMDVFVRYASEFIHTKDLRDAKIDGKPFVEMVTKIKQLTKDEKSMGGDVFEYHTPEFFMGNQVVITTLKPKPLMDHKDLIHFGSVFNISLLERLKEYRANKETWKDFVLPTLDKNQMNTILGESQAILTKSTGYLRQIQHVCETGQQLVKAGRQIYGTPNNIAATRSAIHCALVIWEDSLQGAVHLMERALHAVSMLLEYVAHSIQEQDTSWRQYYKRANIYTGALVGGGLGAFTAPMGVGGIVKGALVGGAIGAGTIAYDNHRRQKWDATVNH